MQSDRCGTKMAGGDARPTNFFIIYGWALRPMKNCSESFREQAYAPKNGT